MKNKHITWEKTYQLPLHFDGWNYAWAANDTMSLMFEFGMTKEDCQKIVDIINGDIEGSIEGIRNEDHEFFMGETYIFCVRGWGYLTGIGGLNLPQEKAAEIQDGFIKFIFGRLK